MKLLFEKIHNKIKNIKEQISDALIIFLLYFLRIYKVKNNRIIIWNFNGKGYGGGPKYISKELIKSKDFEIYWAVNDIYAENGLPKEIKMVKKGTFLFYKVVVTSKFWIDNSRKALVFKKRKEQKYIQTWHGGFPLKKIEFDVSDKLSPRYMKAALNDSKMTDVIISGNSFFDTIAKKTMKYDCEILKCGNPSNDMFFNHDESIRTKICKYVGCGEKDLIVLYAPTFRNNEKKEDYLQIPYNTIKELLSEKYKRNVEFLIRLHPNSNFDINECKNVSAYPDMQELLYSADILITDYSSTMFDFSIMKKPVFLYWFDEDKYMIERSFYFQELPFSISRNDKELVKNIQNYKENAGDKFYEFYNQFDNYENGNASKEIVKYIYQNM